LNGIVSNDPNTHPFADRDLHLGVRRLPIHQGGRWLDWIAQSLVIPSNQRVHCLNVSQE